MARKKEAGVIDTTAVSAETVVQHGELLTIPSPEEAQAAIALLGQQQLPSLPLVALEQEFYLFLKTEEEVPPESLELFKQAQAEQAKVTLDKRDRLGAFIKGQLFLADYHKAEKDRSAAAERRCRVAAERGKSVGRYAIETLPKDANQEYQKLRGKRFTIRLQKNSDWSPIVEDEDSIPAQYKRATVSFPDASVWQYIRATLQGTGFDMTLLGDVDARLEVNITSLKEALERGEEVPGADLPFEPGYHVRVD